MACGLCVGACPTATPLRRASAFVAGIELPGRRLDALRTEIEEATRPLAGRGRVLAFTCGHGAPLGSAADGTATIRVPCVGMIPPSFVDYALTRRLADGVVFAGCTEKGCYERLGVQWTEQRIAGERDPWLRERVPRGRVAVSWRGAGEASARAADLDAFRRQLELLPTLARGQPAGKGRAWRRVGGRWPAPARWLAQGIAITAICGPIAVFATYPSWRQLQPATAVVRLSFSHAAPKVVACTKLTPVELAALKPNMRREVGCARARWPIYLELESDGKILYRGTHEAAGLWKDGPVTFYERFDVPAGPQRLAVRMRETGGSRGFDHVASSDIELVAEQNLVIDFNQRTGFTFR
jgi:coenzyme F420-reducing hydrogenase delta subunit